MQKRAFSLAGNARFPAIEEKNHVFCPTFFRKQNVSVTSAFSDIMKVEVIKNGSESTPADTTVLIDIMYFPFVFFL